MDTTASSKIAAHYDSQEGQLAPVLFGGHVHWGYWDADHAGDSFAAAADRLAQIMVDKTEIRQGQRFIDLGCGVGAPAIKLVKARDCSIDGITISKFQQESATERALAEGLQGAMQFIHGNALAIPCEDQTYDGGWFFESIFHMGHREALAEAARVLKPNALLLLTDLPTLPHTTDEFRAFVRQHIHASFVTKEDYPALLAEAGFELISIEDISANVMPYLVAKLKEAIEQHQERIQSVLADKFDKEIDNWLYTFEYFSEQLGYMLVTARKRSDAPPGMRTAAV